MGNPDWGALAVFVPFARGGQLVQVAVPGYKETMIATVLDGARETLAFDIYVTPLPDGGRSQRVLDDWSELFPGFCLYYPRPCHHGHALAAVGGGLCSSWLGC